MDPMDLMIYFYRADLGCDESGWRLLSVPTVGVPTVGVPGKARQGKRHRRGIIYMPAPHGHTNRPDRPTIFQVCDT